MSKNPERDAKLEAIHARAQHFGRVHLRGPNIGIIDVTVVGNALALMVTDFRAVTSACSVFSTNPKDVRDLAKKLLDAADALEKNHADMVALFPDDEGGGKT